MFRMLAPALSLLASTPFVAAQTCADFDALACDSPVTNQTPGFVFSSVAGQEVRTGCAYDLGTSLPNYICTGAIGGSINCVSPIFVDFVTPVNGLSFLAAGDNTVGVTGLVDVYDANGLLGSVQIVTDGVFEFAHVVDLSAFADVVRIEIYNITNGGGLAFDNFCFDDVGGCTTTTYCDESQNPNNVADISISDCDLSAGTSVDMTNGPVNQATYLLISSDNGVVSQPPGAKGDLCVASANCLGRYAKDIGVINAAGQFSTDISNSLSGGANFGIPSCGGNIQLGQTWYLQYWHRQPMGQLSSFSSALCVTFN
jgi:hypothetical protein